MVSSNPLATLRPNCLYKIEIWPCHTRPSPHYCQWQPTAPGPTPKSLRRWHAPPAAPCTTLFGLHGVSSRTETSPGCAFCLECFPHNEHPSVPLSVSLTTPPDRGPNTKLSGMPPRPFIWIWRLSYIHSFIHSCFLRAYYLPDTVLGPGNTLVIQLDNMCCDGAYIKAQTSKTCRMAWSHTTVFPSI